MRGLEDFGSARADNHGLREKDRKRNSCKGKDKDKESLRARPGTGTVTNDWNYESAENSGYSSRDILVSSVRKSHELSSSEKELETSQVMPVALRGEPPPLAEWSLSTSLYKSSTIQGNTSAVAVLLAVVSVSLAIGERWSE